MTGGVAAEPPKERSSHHSSRDKSYCALGYDIQNMRRAVQLQSSSSLASEDSIDGVSLCAALCL